MIETINYLGDIQRLQPKPGDVFVLTLPKGPPVSSQSIDHIKMHLARELPGMKFLVLEHGATVSVANPETLP